MDDAGSVFGWARMQFETLDSHFAKGFMKIMSESLQETMQDEKELPTLTGRQVAFHINDVESHWRGRLAEHSAAQRQLEDVRPGLGRDIDMAFLDGPHDRQ